MAKLKTVIRAGLPETNSSSSHSVIISELKGGIDLSKYMDGDTLVIPGYYSGRYDFGVTSNRGTNNFITKIVFVISLFSGTCNNPIECIRFLDFLRSIIRSYTGIKKIEFGCIDDMNSTLSLMDVSDYDDKECYNIEFIECTFGSVDHNCISDLRADLFSNREWLKNFLFNPDSWLFLGNESSDNFVSDILRDNYSSSDSNEILASIDFGYNLGRVDFPIGGFYYNNLFKSLCASRDNFLSHIKFDKTKNCFCMGKKWNRYFKLPNEILSIDKVISNSIITSESGEFYLIFSNDEFHDKCYPLLVTDEYKTHGICSFEELTEFCNTYGLKEGDLWLPVKVKFNTKEFGEL